MKNLGQVSDNLDIARKKDLSDIPNKVDKTSTADQIYGTDDSGNQTTYDIDDVATNLGVWGFYGSANNEYIKFMTLAPNTSNDHNYLIYINRNGNQSTVFSGILNIRLRWENNGVNLSRCTMYWVNKTGFGDSDIIAMYDSDNNQVVFYIKSTAQQGYRFKIIAKRGYGIITKHTDRTSYNIVTPDYVSTSNFLSNKSLFHTSDYLQMAIQSNINMSSDADAKITGLSTTTSNIHDSSLTLDTTNDKVVIGAGVSLVKITSVIQYYQKCDATRFGNTIKLNGNNFPGCYIGQASDLAGTTLATNQRRVTVINICYCEVTENDELTFYAKSTGATSSAKDYVGLNETHIIVEVVK